MFFIEQNKRSNLQVVDQQLVQGGVGVQVDQEALVVAHLDPRRLQGDAHALQLLLALLWGGGQARAA